MKIVRISGDDKIIISAFLLHRKKGEDYFLNIRLARKLNLVRSTVHEHRTRSLEILKAMLEENVNENGRKKCK